MKENNNCSLYPAGHTVRGTKSFIHKNKALGKKPWSKIYGTRFSPFQHFVPNLLQLGHGHALIPFLVRYHIWSGVGLGHCCTTRRGTGPVLVWCRLGCWCSTRCGTGPVLVHGPEVGGPVI